MTSVGPTPLFLYLFSDVTCIHGELLAPKSSLSQSICFLLFLFSSSQSKSHSCYNLCPFSAFLPTDLSGSRQDLVFKGRGERGLDVNTCPHARSLAETGQSGRNWERAMQYMASGGSWIWTFPAHLEVHIAAGALCSWRGNTVTVKVLKGTNFVNVIASHRNFGT